MIRRLCCAGALALTLVATSIPAAHAATVSPGKWAPKFCNAVVDYQTTISEKSDAMSTALDSTTDLASARSQIVSFLGDMVTAAKTAKREIQQAGTPSTANGAKIASKFADGLDASAKVFANGKAQAAKISTASVKSFAVDGKKVGADLSAAADELSKSFSGIGKLDTGKKLEAAVKAAPECASLT
jgi:hypothetical protein